MSTAPKCPICRLRQGRPMVEHLATDHSPQVLAEELLAEKERTAAAHRALTASQQTCRKAKFPTEAAALQALLHGWQSGSPRRKEIRAYLCDRCSPATYHLTSRPLIADLDAQVAS